MAYQSTTALKERCVKDPENDVLLFKNPHENKLTAIIEPLKDVMVGIPFNLKLIFTNNSANNVSIYDGGAYRNRRGRDNNYVVRVVDSNGEYLPERFQRLSDMGGLCGGRNIKPNGGTFEKYFFMPDYNILEKSGIYSFHIYSNVLIDNRTVLVRIKTDSVKIQKRDEDRIEKYIDHLLTDTNKEGHVIRFRKKAIGEFVHKKIMKYHVRALLARNYDLLYDATHSLCNYINNDEAFGGLCEVLKYTEEEYVKKTKCQPQHAGSRIDNYQYSAILGLAKMNHPYVMDELCKHSDSKYSSVRLGIIQAIYKVPTFKHYSIVRKAERDESEMNAREASRLIKMFPLYLFHVKLRKTKSYFDVRIKVV